MPDTARLIEHAFPLKQASLDSVHEKNVRHGHISTLHIWPARRPLAACRAALIATLLPDPGTPEGRKKLCERIGGRVVRKMEKKKMPGGATVEREKEQTEAGILHWLGEEPTSGGKKRDEWRAKKQHYEIELAWFREEIKKAYGGRAPKVLDPFAGGGAIPLEAMRLGCETTAIDINPVAWFILKCTLEYPQKLAGQKRPLPAFILQDRPFMERYFEAQGLTAGDIRKELEKLGHKKQAPDKSGKKAKRGKNDAASSLFDLGVTVEADLAWHVRAWGQWVLGHARKELAKFYPVYADFEPLDAGVKSYEHQPMRLVPLAADGTPDMTTLNGDFSDDYLASQGNPRWVAKPTVAYLWARTVTCKNCRATIPLLKTLWLCKKDRKRVLLKMDPNADKSGVVFGVETNVPVKGSNAAQKREHDKKTAVATIRGKGPYLVVQCPVCKLPSMKAEDLRVEARAGRMGSLMTAVVIDGPNGKEYRTPTEHELAIAYGDNKESSTFSSRLPFGVPSEETPGTAGARKNSSTLRVYGMNDWKSLFTVRQLAALAVFTHHSRTTTAAAVELGEIYTENWAEAIRSYMAICVDRIADRGSTLCHWDLGYEKVANTFSGFRLSANWDFAEASPVGERTGSYSGQLEWIAQVIEHACDAEVDSPTPTVIRRSALQGVGSGYDLIITDPPYYDAISYADLMDFFYVWLRRQLAGLGDAYDQAFSEALSPKWDAENNDGELIDNPARFQNNNEASKQSYENGMFRVFQTCWTALADTGRFVIVFAHKHPDAWETLVAALIRAGFVVDASWPIQTEMSNRTRALTAAALSSSVWLVCKKRPVTARPGWDNKVLDEMRTNIGRQLRDFWNAGIRGPDFVWAATGPALEAYSKHPVVKMADEAGKVMNVSDFLSHARRMVVDFVVGRVLSGDDAEAAPPVDRLDEPTAYYLLHRHDFGLDDAPAGACILYATACGLSDDALLRDWDLLVKTGGDDAADEDDDEESDESDEPPEDSGSGSKVKLKPWNHRRGRSLGIEAPGGRPVPLIDRIHRLMHLWKGGDVHKVDEYLDEHGLRRHELFRRVLQSLIELSRTGGEERSLLESLSNHIGAKGAKKKDAQPTFLTPEHDEE